MTIDQLAEEKIAPFSSTSLSPRTENGVIVEIAGKPYLRTGPHSYRRLVRDFLIQASQADIVALSEEELATTRNHLRKPPLHGERYDIIGTFLVEIDPMARRMVFGSARKDEYRLGLSWDLFEKMSQELPNWKLYL